MIYAIGDVHGHLDALKRVLDRVLTDAAAHGVARPKTVFLGDYVDRGPDSQGVLDLLSSDNLTAAIDPVCLRGNHEAALLDVLRGANPEPWFDVGGFATMQSYVRWRGHSLDPYWHRAFNDAFPTRHLDFLCGLATSHRAGRYFFSHAGIDPAKPLGDQPFEALVYGTRAFREWPNALPTTCVVGHWWVREVVVEPDRVWLDTGSGFPGGHLSAVALGDDGSVRVLSDKGGGDG